MTTFGQLAVSVAIKDFDHALPLRAAAGLQECETVVRATIKVNGEGQTLTPATPKPLNKSSPKLACVITSVISTPPCKILFRSDKGFRFRACVTSRTIKDFDHALALRAAAEVQQSGPPSYKQSDKSALHK